ncbi:hypothetical protein [Persephonella sp.]
MHRIFLASLLFFCFGYAFQNLFKWGSRVSDIPGINFYKGCDKVNVYVKDRFEGFSADKVFFYFYRGKLYKISLRYRSFYDFINDLESITGRVDVQLFSIKIYRTDGTLIRIIHTPFMDKIDFVYDLYRKKEDSIERCLYR